MKKSIIHTLQSIKKVIKENESAYDLTQLPVKIKNHLQTQSMPDLQKVFKDSYPYDIENEKYDVAKFTTNVDKVKIYKLIQFTCKGDILKKFNKQLLTQDNIKNSLDTISDNHLFINNETVIKQVQGSMSIDLANDVIKDGILSQLDNYNQSLYNLIDEPDIPIPIQGYFNEETIDVKTFLTNSVYTKDGVEEILPSPIVIDIKAILLDLNKSLKHLPLFQDFDLESFAKYGDLTILKYAKDFNATNPLDTVIYELANWSSITDNTRLLKLFQGLCAILVAAISNGSIPHHSVDYLYKGYIVISINFNKLNNMLREKQFNGQLNSIVLNFLNQEPIKYSNDLTPNVKYIMDMLLDKDKFEDGTAYMDKVIKYAKQLELTKSEFIDAITRVEELNGAELKYDGKNTYSNQVNLIYTNK